MKELLNRELTWIEVEREALTHNIRQFRKIVGPDRILCPCIKAEAYGHGLVETGRIFLDAGADWLGVNALYEARKLRDAGIDSPIYILGYVPLEGLLEACELKCRMVVYNTETVERLGEISKSMSEPVRVHIKIETGNNRQGVLMKDLVEFAKSIMKYSNLEIEGVATHFANIEDTTDHSYAKKQLNAFLDAVELLESEGVQVKYKHTANSAATLIMDETRLNMVRPGISCYGMWPSNEAYVSYQREVGGNFELKPSFTWKSKIAQIKTIAAGEYIGYGCTFRTSHETKLAVVPIGYYDGYDRGVSGAHVLVRGQRAPVRGRVCMNIIMVEVTDIPQASLEDEVVLIGGRGEERISAEQFASWAGTINYEVPTRVNERIPRIIV